MTLSAFLESAVSLSLQVTLLVLITAWLARCTQRDLTGDRLWQACYVLILLLAVATFALPHLRLFPSFLALSGANREAALNVQAKLGLGVLWLWMAGMVIGVGALILSTLLIHRILRSANPIEFVSLINRCPATRATLPDGRTIHWRQSDVASGPFCWQIHQPLIVLPTFVLEFSDDELQAVITHETTHLTAGHPLHLFLQRVVELLFWFHPIVWWASWQAAAAREYVCDHSAACSSDEAAACLRSLLRLAEKGITVTGGLPAGLSFGAGASLTRNRAARLAEFDAPQSVGSIDRYAVFLLVAMSLAASSLHVPLNAMAFDRSIWSPWPTWSARVLQIVDISARDYEIDSHRAEEQNPEPP